MQKFVNGEEPFKCAKNTFAVGPTSNGFTLAYSVSRDGEYTEYTESTPAGENLVVNGVTPYMWFKLMGNSDDNVEIIL